MILPQYSLRKLLAMMVGFALFCLVVSWGVRGNSWAYGAALAGMSIAVALVVQALLFWLVWLFATAFDTFRKRRAVRSGMSIPSQASVALQTSDDSA